MRASASPLKPRQPIPPRCPYPQSGRTPLWTACRLGYDELAELLLEKGAEKDAQDEARISQFNRRRRFVAIARSR